MAAATERKYGLRAVEAARAALDGPWGKTPPTETKSVLVSTSPKPINPFGL